MRAKIEGECINVGESEFEGKKYPYFEILQKGEGFQSSQVFRVSGNGIKMGEKASFDALVTLNDKGHIRVKKIDAVPFKAAQKPL